MEKGNGSMSAKDSQICLRHGIKFRMERRTFPARSVQSHLPVYPVKGFSRTAKVFREHQRGLIFLDRAFFVALLLENRP